MIKCPNCQKTWPDDKQICDACDYIIDKSFLGENFTDEERKDKQKILPKVDSKENNGKPKLFVHRGGKVGKYLKKDKVGLEPEENFFRSLEDFFSNLEKEEKIILISMTVGVILAFLPWLNVPVEGNVEGIRVGGWIVVLLLLGIGTLFWYSYEKVTPFLARRLILTQIGLAVLCLIWTLIILGQIFRGTILEFPLAGGLGRLNLTPGYGIFLTILVEIILLSGLLMQL